MPQGFRNIDRSKLGFQKGHKINLGKPCWRRGKDFHKKIKFNCRSCNKEVYDYSFNKKKYCSWRCFVEDSRSNPKINPFYGKHHSEETIRKLSESFMGHHWNKGISKSEEIKRKISETKKRLYKEGKIIPWNKDKHHSEETKKKLSETRKKLFKEGKLVSWGKNNPTWSKKLWENPEYREKTIKAILKGLFKRPTSLEKQFIEIIQKYNLPYKYVGDGSFLIGFKSPDFINTNGEKICIETRPREMCQIWNKCSPEEYEEKQISHYSKFGWKCVVLWKEELQDENNLIKIPR